MGGHPGHSPEEGLTSVARRDTEQALGCYQDDREGTGDLCGGRGDAHARANKFQRLIVHGYANQPGFIDRDLLLTTASSPATVTARGCLRRAKRTACGKTQIQRA